jgi:hypothetical protein
MSIYPLQKNNQYDKPVNAIIKPLPLDDELGWDRVKKIFSLEYVSYTYLTIKSLFASFAYIKHTFLYNGYYNFIFQ